MPTEHFKRGLGGSGHFVAGGMVTEFRVDLFASGLSILGLRVWGFEGLGSSV